jgi:hypothetical protein
MYGKTIRIISAVSSTLPGVRANPPCKQVDEPWGRERPGNRQHDQHDRQQRADVADEEPRSLHTSLAAVFRQDGNERLRERAFREQAAQ